MNSVRQKWILAATVLGSSMAFIDSSVVNVALPRIQADLSTTLSAMTWVINAYTLCLSSLILIGGAAGDRFGRRRAFLAGICVFALASLGCGLTPTADALIFTRACQGVGAALLIPCALAIIGATFDEKERGAAIGIWSSASAIAAGAGPLLGGWLVDHLSWRAIFLINPAIAVPTIAIALRHFEAGRDSNASRALDWTGALLAFAAFGLLVYGLIAVSDHGWRSQWVTVPLTAGSALLICFLMAQRFGNAPMMPLDVFHSRTFSGVNVLTFLLYGALGGSLFFVPFLLIQVHHYSATEAGAAFVPFTVMLGALSTWGGHLTDRFGSRTPLILGPLIVAAGFALFALAGSTGPYWSTFLAPMLVLGFGMAVTVAPLTTTVLNSVPDERTGLASGINNAVAQVASLLAIAAFSTVRAGSFTATVRVVMLIAAALAVASAASAAFTIKPAARS